MVRSSFLLLSLLFPFISSKSYIDCYHGFIGEMQASVHSGFISANDTRVCAAEWCMKVLVHSAIDNDGYLRRGVASRCAYTGGDRQLCYSAADRGEKACTTVHHYDGMTGNFSMCCCRSNYCNHPLPEEIIFNKESAKIRRESTMEENSSQFIQSIFTSIPIFIHLY